MPSVYPSSANPVSCIASHAVALATTKKTAYSDTLTQTTPTSLNGGHAHPMFTHFLPTNLFVSPMSVY